MANELDRPSLARLLWRCNLVERWLQDLGVEPDR
jgi:hypothetical protein